MSIRDDFEVRILPETVDEETYLAEYAAQHMEWVEGRLIALSPVRDIHNAIAFFVMALLEAYISRSGEGKAFNLEFVMRLQVGGKRRYREPDAFVVTPDQYDRLHPTYFDGGAALVVEVVSDESLGRDKGEKFLEYEVAGVREYWIIDPQRKESLFYLRGEDGLFALQGVDEDGFYQCTVLPRLRFKVAIFYQAPPPNFWDAARIIQGVLPEG